ncbi:type IV secretion system DNA-binding domain-containing protein (plasmid) [Nocardiopsis flavescens]|nr:type IV secretion system DNA-binding domain-containing protein [Nocardiopsis flavescens]
MSGLSPTGAPPHGGAPAPRPLPGQDWLRLDHPRAAQAVAGWWNTPGVNDIDRTRIARALDQAARRPELRRELAQELLEEGPAAAVHTSGQRDLPLPRLAHHNLARGQVLLGRAAHHPKVGYHRQGALFGLDTDCLRTNMLVIGPPGSGKTRSLALPVTEHLALSSLANAASVVVIDPKGDDFDHPGWFDITIDPEHPRTRFSIYGGARSAEEAADQIASALLPEGTSGDVAYFMDASRNVLYHALAAFTAGHKRWPTIPELLTLLNEKSDTAPAQNALRAGLNNSRLPKSERKRHKDWLDYRIGQLKRREDPAASLLERLGNLNRPHLTALLDPAEGAFRMADINDPIRVRVALRETQYPEASRFLARLVVSQFTNTVCDQETNRGIFKGLVVDEAGRYVDSYVARTMQRARSNNSGLMLLSQTLGDFPPSLLQTLWGTAGGKAAFGGIGPDDAEMFSRTWGEEEVMEYTYSANGSITYQPGLPWGAPSPSYTRGRSTSGRSVRKRRWEPGELSADLPQHHAVVQLRSSTGRTTPPELIDLRAPSVPHP